MGPALVRFGRFIQSGGGFPRAFLNFCASLRRLRVGASSGPVGRRAGRAANGMCQFCCLQAVKSPREHRGPAPLDLLLMKKPHGIALLNHSRFIPLHSLLFLPDPSAASSYHNQRFDRGPKTWTRVLRGIGRALFRGSRSYSRQVSAAQQIDVPSLEEVSTDKPMEWQCDKKGKGERVRERKDRSIIRQYRQYHSIPTDLINLALLFIARHVIFHPCQSGLLQLLTSGVRPEPDDGLESELGSELCSNATQIWLIGKDAVVSCRRSELEAPTRPRDFPASIHLVNAIVILFEYCARMHFS